MKTIGILGGMGPEATNLLYKKIIRYTNSKSDQDNIPTIIYSNTAIPDRTKAIIHQGEDPTPALIYSAEVLERAGANIIVMPCNTAHYFYKQIAEKISVDFLNMVHLTNMYILEQLENKKIGIFATSGTLKAGIYNQGYFKKKVELVFPNKKDQDVIMNTIYDGVKSKGSKMVTKQYEEIIRGFESAGIDAILLGCTELSYLHSHFHFNTDLQFIDPLDILTKSVVERARML